MQRGVATTLMIACILGGTMTWPHPGTADTAQAGSLTAPVPTTEVAAPTGATAPAPALDAMPPGNTEAAPGRGALPEGVTPELMADGEKLFLKNCRQCHGSRGKAGVPLAGNENIADPAYIASMIINGRGYMPGFGEHLSDEQIAAIGTFARNSWGNAYGPVTPGDVKDMR